jgi:tRNA (guanine-N7-)-methyltransferase
MNAAVTATQPYNVLPRPALAGEFVPHHYFRTLEPGEICRDGRPLEIDLGCGDGSFLFGMAKEYPDRDFLGVERLLGRVRKVCKKITRRHLENARVLRLESRYVVEWLLADGLYRSSFWKP